MDGQNDNKSLRPNVNLPDQLAPRGASYGADNQLAPVACKLAIPKLNRSNAMTMSGIKPKARLVTLGKLLALLALAFPQSALRLPQGSRQVIGKMRNCGMRKVKCGIQKCGNVCGMVGEIWNAES